MGLLIDTDLWALAENAGTPLNFARWADYGGAYMSALTASELLAGVERADTAERRAQRGAFVENLLSSVPVLEFSMPVARTHARLLAALPDHASAGAHDALIAATAVHHGFALLTRHAEQFRQFSGLTVEAFAV